MKHLTLTLLALLACGTAWAQSPTPLPSAIPPFVVGPEVQITPVSGHTDPLLVPPQPTAEEIAARDQCLEDRYQARRRSFTLPIDPFAVSIPITSPPTEAAGPADAPGDFRVFRNTLMTGTFTNNQTSSTNEPSFGMNGRFVLYTGNWYASVSGDYGQTFTYRSPYTSFPAPASGGFCCDQVVYYDPTRNLTCWYLQYTGSNNPGRLVVYRNQQDLLDNNYTYYDLTPSFFGFAATATFDFPDMSASSSRLYITTNVGGGTDAAIVMRFFLDDLAAGGSASVGNFRSPTLPNLRCTHGAAGTMYVGTQVNTSTLRIFSWPEGSGTPTSVDRAVSTWFTATSNATSPDGTNWAARDFHDILAAATGNGTAVFMWDSSQGGGLTYPNIRYARFNTAGMTLADQGAIFNGSFAWAYPSIHTNSRGHFGGVLSAGGGTAVLPYPRLVCWIADDFNATTIAPLENVFLADSTNGPANNRWGDFYTARQCNPYSTTWLGAGYTLNGGGGNANAEARFAWFGRERDTPPTNNTIYVDRNNTSSWRDGTAAHPYPTCADGFFAGVNYDTVIVRGNTYLENFAWNKILTVRNETGNAVIGGF